VVLVGPWWARIYRRSWHVKVRRPAEPVSFVAGLRGADVERHLAGRTGGALYPVQDKAYENSGYVRVSDRALSSAGNFAHYVDEAAVAFRSADESRAFVKSSADKWKFCPGRNLTATYTKGAVHRWQFGKLTGAPPENCAVDGWACQRVLRAVSNVVLDVDACGYGITDEAARSPTR